MFQQRRAYWRNLDNAAKMFSAASSPKDTRVFRFYCVLKEKIDGSVLKMALDQTIQKYPVFLSVMRKGLFWHYLEKSDLRPVVREEYKEPCSHLYIRDKKELLFEVTYYKNRINFEVFHALTDGTGATEFLRELVKNYLYLMHEKDGLENVILTEQDLTVKDQEEDGFGRYYNPDERGTRKKKNHAYQIRRESKEYEELQIGEEYMLHCGETSLPITFAPYGVGDLRLKYGKIIGAPMSLTVQTFASENGLMPLDEYDLNDLPRNIKASIQTETGYVTSDNKLVLRQFGDTATVTATYHTNRWNAKGEEEGNITKEFTITADENAFIKYKIERVEYTYTGTSEDYITVQLNYPLNQDYKVMMGWPKHFQLQIQSPYPSDSNWFRKYIVYSTKRVGEGNRIIISFPSDQLYDGGTYVLRVFGFGTALSHQSEPFTIHKRTYYPSAPTPTPTPDGPTTDTDGSDKDDTGDTMPPTDGDDDNNGDTPPTDRDDDNNGDTPPTGTGDSENNDNTPATDKK